MTFYTKEISPKGKVTYKEYLPDNEAVIELTDAQCLTAAGSLGITLLTIFERNFPEHKRVAKKIKAVEQSVLDLYSGTGQPIDPELADYFCKAWDRTIREISIGGDYE